MNKEDEKQIWICLAIALPFILFYIIVLSHH